MCIIAFVLALGMAFVSAQSAPAFSTLTVPAASLPDGCRIAPPAPEPTPLRLPSNPWSGTDYQYIAQVRQAFERVPAIQLPDGPPLDPKEAARLAWTLKGNIAEAYRASYESTSSGSILVQAVRYTEAKWATPGEGRIVRGSAVIIVAGHPQSECFKAVQNYIQSLK